LHSPVFSIDLKKAGFFGLIEKVEDELDAKRLYFSSDALSQFTSNKNLASTHHTFLFIHQIRGVVGVEKR
jgi:hypothetical protein